MTTKQLETLVEDVYGLFDPEREHEVNEDNLNVLKENIGELMKRRLNRQEERNGDLRFSALGKPDRQIWMQAQERKGNLENVEKMSPKTYFKFLYGDIIEEMLLFLIKEAGHKVEAEQAEVEVDGVKGHIDAIIDGVVVDVKSASPFGYKKFENGDLFTNDPFGYVQQLSGYNNVLNPGKPAAFIAFDKVAGDICILDLPPSISQDYLPAPRIEHLKGVLANENPPEKCYDDQPEGKSGNRSLVTGCSYCPFKKECWPGVRIFLYSNGPKFLTHVAKRPKETIHEVTT